MLRALILALAAVATAVAGEVRIVSIPGGGVAPQAMVDAKGVLHLVYGRQGNAYYVRSADNGRNLSAPLRINTTDGGVTVGEEKGPRLALGAGGAIHVAWTGRGGRGAWYSRFEGGKFPPERNVNDVDSAVGGTAIAADLRGRVLVFWIDSRAPEDPKSPVAQPIFYARSEDNGESFGDSREVKSDYPGRACAGCSLAALADASGMIRLAFRGGYEGLRNMELLESHDGQRFTWREVYDDKWKLPVCPVSSPDLKLVNGLPGVAWMSQEEIYYRIGDGARTGPAAPKEAARDYPFLLVNAAGERLLAWTEGRALHWELTSPNGAPPQTGFEKSITFDSRPGGFTGTDGNFYLIP